LFYQPAKHAVENNASLPVQQIYEAQRVKERALSAFPDFNDVRSTLTRIKTKKANLCKGRNINEVIVKNKLTADGKKFLISDNNKKNRIIVFAFPTGLKMLPTTKVNI